MRFSVFLVGTLAAPLLVLSGCSRPAATDLGPALAAAASNSPAIRGLPQPRLTTIKLWLGPKEIVAEQALTIDQVQKGMMLRKEMGEDEGMIFVFTQPHRASFYMRNTLLPLSCAYIDSAGVILELHDMKPLDETPIPAKSDQVQYVLEMKQGWFERNKIGVGTVVRSERGSLSRTYFGR